VKTSNLRVGMRVYLSDWLGWHESIVLDPSYRRSAHHRPAVRLAVSTRSGEWHPQIVEPQSVKSVDQYEADVIERLRAQEKREARRAALEAAHVEARNAADRLRHAGFVVRSSSVDGSKEILVPLVTIDVRSLPSQGLLLIPETLLIPEGTSTEDFLAELRAAFALGIVEKP